VTSASSSDLRNGTRIDYGPSTATHSFGHFVMTNWVLVIVLLFVSGSGATAADYPGTLPTAEQIVIRMAALDLQRQSLVDGYAGMRRYVLDARNSKMHAEMLVHVKGDQDGTKHFQIVSENGCKPANTHVLRKMLESESETSQPGQSATSRLNFTNYEFEMIGTEILSGRQAYVLAVKPKRKDEYLFDGRIWVDAQDYALARAEGTPAKNLSFWTKTTHFVQVYQKNGPLWFPLSMKSVTEARLFGTTDVNIDYFDYGPETVASAGIALPSAKETYERSTVDSDAGVMFDIALGHARETDSARQTGSLLVDERYR
jgi:hypothetical protein